MSPLDFFCSSSNLRNTNGTGATVSERLLVGEEHPSTMALKITGVSQVVPFSKLLKWNCCSKITVLLQVPVVASLVVVGAKGGQIRDVPTPAVRSNRMLLKVG